MTILSDKEICESCCGIDKAACFGQVRDRCPDMIRMVEAQDKATKIEERKWFADWLDDIPQQIIELTINRGSTKLRRGERP